MVALSSYIILAQAEIGNPRDQYGGSELTLVRDACPAGSSKLTKLDAVVTGPGGGRDGRESRIANTFSRWNVNKSMFEEVETLVHLMRVEK